MAEKFDKLGADAAALRAISAKITDSGEQRALTAIAADAILWRRRDRGATAAAKPAADHQAAPQRESAETPDEGLGELLALAARVGLKGFRDKDTEA